MTVDPMLPVDLRPLGEADLPLLADWLGRPQVAARWGPAPDLEEVRRRFGPLIGSAFGQAFIGTLGGRPIAYLQSFLAPKASECRASVQTYRTAGPADAFWPDQPAGTAGVDAFVAEPERCGRGLGSALVRRLVDRLLADSTVQRILADPAPDNARAIGCYRRAGFRQAGEITKPDGPALLMILERGASCLRVATPADAAQLAALCDQLGYPTSPEALVKRLELVEHEDEVVLCAKRAGRPVGLVHVTRRRPLHGVAIAEIEALVVDEALRGQGTGAGLMAAAERWAARRGLEKLRVRSQLARTRAHAFYRRLGYQVSKTQHVFVRALSADLGLIPEGAPPGGR
jgi:GNAT superfamily N-acetyltransferase